LLSNRRQSFPPSFSAALTFSLLWKAAYKKYESSDTSKATTKSIDQSTLKKLKSSSEPLLQNLLPHDVILRDLITRFYGCQIIDTRLEIVGRGANAEETAPVASEGFAHPNLYPVIAAIETHNHIFIVHQPFVEFTLHDCINYSPSILSESHNKPLFILYQLINLIKSLHDRNLLVGQIGLEDICMSENLWLQVLPRLDTNLLPYEDWMEHHQELFEARNPAIKRHLSASAVSDYSKVAPLLRADPGLSAKPTLEQYCKMWCNRELSNFDYLMILNEMSGRQKGNPLNSYIFPWVTDFSTRNGLVWRDLTKSKYRLNKGDAQLDLTFQSLSLSTSSTSSVAEMPHHVSDVLSEITYYVYMARRTSKSLLCKYVRPIFVAAEYPSSIQRLQEWSPDEAIPEFYSEPIVFKSIHEDLPDLEVPVWSTCPEDFVLKHREALESQNVSEKLHDWINLNFG
jgi:WD repeat-containing protein 81